MTLNPSGRAERPPTELSLDARVRHAHYFRALSSLSPLLAHDLRARLGAALLHLDFASELLGFDAHPTPEVIERARDELARASESLRQLPDSFETMFGLTRPVAQAPEGFDLRDTVVELGRVIRAVAGRRQVEWTLRAPEVPVRVAGDPDALRQALVIVLADALVGLEPGDRLELVLVTTAESAVITISGRFPDVAREPAGTPSADAADGSEIVRNTFEHHEGHVRRAGPTKLELTLPLVREPTKGA